MTSDILIFISGLVSPYVVRFILAFVQVSKIAVLDTKKAWNAGLIDGTPAYRWADVLPRIFCHSWYEQMRSRVLYGAVRVS